MNVEKVIKKKLKINVYFWFTLRATTRVPKLIEGEIIILIIQRILFTKQYFISRSIES